MIAIGIVCTVAVVVAGVLFWGMTHSEFSVQTVFIKSVSVTDQHIDILFTTSSSAMAYTGYSLTSDNGSLYFTLHASMFDTWFSRIQADEISIPNAYGNIQSIYVRDSRHETKLIWQRASVPAQ